MAKSKRMHNKRLLAGAGLAFAIGFAVAALLAPQLPLRAGRPPDAQRYPAFDEPTGSEFFYAVPEHTELSHSILWHDLGDSIANARAADILFVGSSQTQLGLRGEFIVPRAEALGLRVFSLATGYAQRARFASMLIERHDLHPKVVVVSGKPAAFRDSWSMISEQAMQMTRWDAAKQWLEEAAAWNLRWRLHAWLPRLDFFDRRLHSQWILYRSERTGWWLPVAEPDDPTQRESTTLRPPRKQYYGELAFARELKNNLEARGALLVLTTVPGIRAQTGHLGFLGEQLRVPYVLPLLEGTSVSDHSHLDRESARRVSDHFWETFIALPEVRARLGLDAATAAPRN